MNYASLVEAISAGLGAGVVTGGAMRRYWLGREGRQQVAFKVAVQKIVDESIADVIRRQTEFERRQGQHLDRQDAAIERLRRAVERRRT